MIKIEDWYMINHMHKQGVPKARIARDLGLDRKTVYNAIRGDECPKHDRQSRGSKLELPTAFGLCPIHSMFK